MDCVKQWWYSRFISFHQRVSTGEYRISCPLSIIRFFAGFRLSGGSNSLDKIVLYSRTKRGVHLECGVKGSLMST